MSRHSPESGPHAELIIPIVGQMKIDPEGKGPDCTPLIIRNGTVEEVQDAVKFSDAIEQFSGETGIKSVNAHAAISSLGGYKSAMDAVLAGFANLDGNGTSHSYAIGKASSAASWTFLGAVKRAIVADTKIMFHVPAGDTELGGVKISLIDFEQIDTYKEQMLGLLHDSGADNTIRVPLLRELEEIFRNREDSRYPVHWTGQQLADLGYADLLEDGDALGQRFVENTGVNVDDTESLAIVQAQWSSFIDQIKTSS